MDLRRGRRVRGGRLLLRISKDEGDLDKATADMEALKGKKSSVSSALTGAGAGVATLTHPVKNVVFACDAGMGSSAMGASSCARRSRRPASATSRWSTRPSRTLTDSYDIMVTHQDLAARAAPMAPSAKVFTVDNFMGSPVYDQVVEAVKAANSPSAGAPATAPDAAAAPAASSPAGRRHSTRTS